MGSNRQHNNLKCRRRRWAPIVVVNNRHGGTTSEHNINTDRVIRYRNIIHYYYKLCAGRVCARARAYNFRVRDSTNSIILYH